MKKISALLLLFALLGTAVAQNLQNTELNGTTTGTTVTLPPEGAVIVDDGAGNPAGNYSDGHDYWITFTGSCTAPSKLYFLFENFDIHPSDTVYVYDGASTRAPLLEKGNNNNSLLSHRYYVSASNTSNSLTLRIKSNSDGLTGTGFTVHVGCETPCENITPVIEDIFYRTRNGVVYDTARIVDVNTVDEATGQIIASYRSINVCEGDGVIIKGHGVYSHNTGYYTPTDATTRFEWALSTGEEAQGINMTSFTCANFPQRACYEVTLHMTDERGCISTQNASTRIRIAGNPIVTISDDLAVFCNDTCQLVTTAVGEDGSAGTLVYNPTPSDVISRTNEVKTFIPDGPNCPGDNCYKAPVEFTEFPNGRLIQSANDICSICVNYEHSFMGDYDLKIECPNHSTATLKYKNQQTGMPDGTGGGSGTYTGYPYGGSNDSGYDARGPNGNYCDSIYNMFGVGLDYCFSRNANYTLVDGLPANTTQTSRPHYLGNTGSYIDQVTYTFDVIPRPYYDAGTTCGTSTFSTKHPSNHDGKYDYYQPADNLSSLVGCPMNGVWNIVICDSWSIDNGWVFSWSLDMCGVNNAGVDCQYTVGIDSIRWAPDYTAGDWDLGYYRGVYCNNISDDSAYVSTPDTAGVFPVYVHVYDEFGCVWDTLTHIKTSWTPQPNLGNDTAICDPESILLVATDPHEAQGEFSYTWEPYGQTESEIWTTPNTGTDTNYIVHVVNSKFGIECRTSDTIHVGMNAMPSLGFTTDVVPAAGCSPFMITFIDTSAGATYYHWDFGDGYTSTHKNPRHVYAPGKYDVGLVVTTEFGCVDSIRRPEYVWAFNSPDAQFSWEPNYPSLMNPAVQFMNQTVPMTDENMYDWYIQTDRNNPDNFYHTSVKDASYTWPTTSEAGTYLVKLYARTNNYNQDNELVVCKDSVESNVMLVQDFLQFPTVITPNGDGINDKFVIKNLIDGLGYPNNSLRIYNRWGILVFSKENITTEEDFWDPAAHNTPAGTYFFYFTGHGYNGNVQRNGAVEVLR